MELLPVGNLRNYNHPTSQSVQETHTSWFLL
jgi:hypothetical protein